MLHVRHRSDAVDVDRRQPAGRGSEAVAVFMGLGEFTPVGGRAPGGRFGWRLARFAQMREDFPDRPWLHDGRNQPDVAGNMPAACLSVAASRCLPLFPMASAVTARLESVRRTSRRDRIETVGVKPRPSVNAKASSENMTRARYSRSRARGPGR
jgi:hypothetical protein